MNRRILIRTVVALGLIALVGLFAAPVSPLSWHDPATVEANNPPAFSDENTKREVNENTPSFGNIGDPVTATDSDNDRLVYSLENARTSPFTIVRATGQLQVGQPLDHETEASYTVKVVVTDPDDATDTITVTINVNNVEEPGKVTLTWTRPQVGAEITASLTDPDVSVSGETWRWERSNNRSNWSDITGATSARYTPVDDDKGKYLRATVTYTDALGPTGPANSAAGYVKPVPDPNQPPEFRVNTSGGYSCPEAETAHVCLYVRRSAPAGSDIYYPGYVHITDHDEVRYSLIGTDADRFRIGPLSGDLYTTAAHAYDDPGPDGKFEITITATDPSGLSNSIDVVLKPSGGTGNPVVNGPERIQYSENGTWPVATYSATASPNNRDIRGWIIGVQPGGGDGDFFDIDDDGVLTFTQPPDYEDPADENGDRVYNFSLHVYDTNPPNQGRPAQTFFPVRVTVVDVEVEALEILGPSAVEYPENGTDLVATYSLEGGSGPSVEWFLSGADAGAFSLSQGGQLTFIQRPDYENPTDVAEENAYLVTITADRGGASKTEFIRVKVTNVNEPPEFDEGETATRSVTRDAEVNALIGEPVAATDPDEGGYLTYTLPDADTLPFSISKYTGHLSLSGTLPQDRSTYTVAVLVTDGQDAAGDPDTSEDDRIIVTISVEGDGNSAPEFPSTETGARSFPENSTGGQNVGGPVTATDGDNDRLIYTLGGTDAADFQILGTTGQIQTKAGVTYDHETTPSYSVTVKADDSNGGTNTIDVTITVDDVDEPPAFTNGPTTVEYAENDTRVVGYYYAEDPEDGSVPLTLAGDDVTLFSFTGGNLAFIDPPDFEAKGSDDGDNDYQVTVQAISGTDTVTLNVTVTVTDVNEAPAFPDSETARSVVENTAPGENIGTPVEADDPDADANLTYIMDGTDAGHFNFDPSTGQIKTKLALDKETEDTYFVTVSVTDGKADNGGVDRTPDDSTYVTITVTGENDAPTITGGPTAVTDYAENSDANVGTYIATDPEDDSITWSVSGTDSGDFEISTSGVLSFKSSPNFESPDDDDTNNVYLVTVVASDTGKTDTRAVTVTVTNVNEPPAFPSSETRARSVVENTPANQNIGAPVAASDPDAGASLTYSLAGTDASAFNFDTATGQIKTNLPLDREDQDTYTVIVSVTDGLNDSGSADTTVDDTITVTITVTDENEPPVIATGRAAINYAENGTGTVETYTATDMDTDTALLAWTPSGDDAALFDITDGVLTFKAPPNFEAPRDKDGQNDYQVTVQVSDGPNTVTQAATVTVTNVNELPAFAAETATREVAENTPAGQSIGAAVSATDPDAGDTLTYTLGGTDVASFDIVESTGQLQTKAALDKETEDTYTVIVSVTDGIPDTAEDDSITVTITVTDEDDAPAITSGRAAIDYAENGTGDVETYTATDTDTDSASLTWTLGGDDAALFDITDGILTFKSPPNFEVKKDANTDNAYEVTVRVSDGPNRDTLDVTVTVTDINEPPTFPSTEDGRRSVVENTASGQDIGDPVAAADPEGDDLTYSLRSSDADAASFAIVATTGQLQTKDTPDADTKALYSFTIEVSDSKDAGGTADTVTDAAIAVQITVTGVNEAPAISGDASPSHAENDDGVVAAYADNDPEEAGITWTLSGDDAGDFSINSDGELKFGAAPDYETPADDGGNNVYLVTLTASDGTHTDTFNVTVTVTNVNEAPTFPGPTETLTIPENTVAAQNIGIPVMARDPDTDVAFATLTYTLGGTSDEASFDIVGSSGQLQTKDDLDYESKASYSVTVSVTDGKDADGNVNPAVDASVTVTITVIDMNDAPVITGPISPTYDENATSEVATYAATDQDSGDTVTWRLSGTDDASLSLSDSGVLTFNSPPDFEDPTDVGKNGEYLVAIEAFDQTATTTRPVTITIANVEEPGAVTFDSLQPQVSTVLTAEIEDPDGVSGATWQWQVFTGGISLWTTISGATSASYTPVEADETKFLRATATYTDGEGSGKSAQGVTASAVQAAPMQNTAPEFADETTTRTVPENSPVGTNVGAPVTATDSNSDILSYSLVGSTDAESFSINQSSGQLQTKAILDRETKDSYTVTVTAADPSDESDTIAVTIAVADQNEGPSLARTDLLSYPENGTADIVEYTASDPEGGTVTWSLSGTDSARFSVAASVSGSSSVAVLTFRAPPDFEAPGDSDENNAYLVTVAASDGPNSNHTDVIVTVTNVNERPEFLSTETGTRSLAENTVAGQPIGVPVTATDPDNGDTLTYTLGGTDAASFDIVASSGQLQTKADLDLESKASYSVTVSVRDSKDNSGNADTATDDTIAVTITVTNLDDPPEITGGPARVSYAENGTGDVATYAASDPEQTTIIWSVEGDDKKFFDITGGVLTFLSPPNFEAEGQEADADEDDNYEVTVVASDGAKTDTRAVTVTVTDVNESPEFPAATDTRSVQENTATDQNIGLPVEAADPDVDADLTYGFGGGADDSSFDIDTSTGQLKTKVALDKETDDSYTVIVSVTDGKDASGNTEDPAVVDDTVTVTITVTDQNEPPEFTGGGTAVDYAENGTGAVETYTASDTDTDAAALTWTLDGDDAGQFDNSGGVLTFKSPPNFEVEKDANTDNAYEVTVQVSDGEHTATRAVTVTVTNVNDKPSFPAGETGARSVEEGTEAGEDIGSPVAATDADGDTLTYSVTGPDAAAFTFDTSTGQLTTDDALDADTKATYSFTIGVSDSKDASGSADNVVDNTINVTITVIAGPPEISGDASPVHPENDTSAVGTYAGNAPQDVTIDWTLSGDDRGDFLFTSGELTFKNTPDFETPVDQDRNNIYLVTLEADYGTSTDTFDVTVTVTNKNEPPAFPATTDTRSVPENTAPGQNIGLPVMARDPDVDAASGTLTYTLGGTDAASFGFDTSTGQLKTSAALDHEVKGSYTVTVSVTDGKDAAGNADTAADDTVTVTISVTGANDPPVITGSDSITYAENGTGNVATYTATDQDSGDTVRWRLSGPDGSGVDSHGLSISSTGVLTFISPPNFEEAKDKADANGDGAKDNVYLVTVEAFDGTVITTQDVTITVSNVDEAGELTFLALQPQVGTELTAKIVDPDGSVTPTTWKWEISDDGSSGWSTIANETSESYTPVATDVDKYLRVTLTYTDALPASKTLTARNANAVQAAPITNTPPEFDGETTARSVGENAPVGTNVGAPVTATDPQTDTLTYFLVDSDVETSDAASFTISQASGQLRTNAVLDRETKASYTVTVKATDPSGLNDTITVTISVTDQNEAPVVARTDRISYAENSTVDIVEYTARDPEGVTIIWSPTGPDSARFEIDAEVVDENSVAALKFKTVPDFEAPTDSGSNNVYLVTVVASDGTYSNATDVIVTVTDVNERPAFPSTENGQRTVREDTGTGQDIGSPVAAVDLDAGDSLTYTLGGADAASFGIVEATGQLQTKVALEYDTQSRYTVSVTATDTADNSVTIAVAIVVTEVVEAPAPPPPPPPQQRPVQPPPVQRAPTTKPTIDSVTPENRSLTVAWSAPGDTDGQTITSYDMRHIKSSVANPADSDWIATEDVWTGAGDLVYDLIGLDNDAEYNVQVRAGYLVDAGPWSDSETGTPTAGTESDDGCRLTLGSPSGTVTQTGTWTSDCDSVNRIGSYALFYTFTLKQETELQIDLTSSQDTYLFLLNGAGTDGAVAASNDDVVVTEDVNSRISTTLAAGAYTIEATTYTPRITGDFTVTITVAGGDGSAVGPPGGTQPPGTTPPGGQQPQPPGTTPPGGQQPPAQVGPADAPTITSVTPGTETLTVAWEAPSDTGSSEITAYDLRHIHSSVTERTDSDWIVLEDAWTGSGALEYQLTGLTDNIGYDIQVRASYAIGSGSWSLTASGTPGTTGSPGTGTPTGDACHVNLKTLTTNVELTGTWVSDCESVNREGRYARFYSFTLGQAGQVQIDLTSTQDPYLFLLEGGTTDGKVVVENDDVVVNENTNSRIVTTLAAGSHTIEATTYHTAQTGEFSLTISLPQGSGGSGGSPPGSSGPGTPSEDGCEVDLNVLTSRVSREGYWAFDCDSTNRAGRYARYYTFTLRQEAELQIDVVSTEDPFAFLLEGAGKDGEVLAKNDDVAAGTDLNSRISATLAAGRYTIEATTYSEEVAGEFTLTIAFTEAVEDIPDPCVTPLETPTGVVTQTGTWADDCQSTNRIGTYARFYSFTLEQEAELQIDLMSSHDPFLFLLHGDGRDGTLVAQNDDVTVSVDLNSRISMTLAAGTYTIEATTYNTWATGDFTLRIVGPEGTSAQTTDVCVEDLGTPSTVVTKTGTWTDACDSTSREGQYARFYTFTLEQQSEVQIDLVSTQDPYLFLLQGTGTNGAEVDSNDDIVPNVELDSQISVTLAAGSYTIEATTYDVGETGAFTLTLTP